jgi:AcrR family transcriptional regulator
MATTAATVPRNGRIMENRKKQFTEAALAHLIDTGVANMSLRPMAAALGTTPRMLMFYFKSKEGLLQELIVELHDRLQASFSAAMSRSAGEQQVPALKRAWQWATRSENLPLLRLACEIQVVAAQNPAVYGRYLKRASSDWQEIAAQALSKSLNSTSLTTLCIAVFDGLLLEMIMTGDRARLTRALDEFILMLRTRAVQG